MDDKLFIRSEDGQTLYEGPLGENANNIKLLFVMKEPNGEELNCFWIKRVFNKDEKTRFATRYYNVLGAFAKSILGSSHRESLEQSAYINLYPFRGCSTSIRDEDKKSYLDLMDTWEKYQRDENLLDLNFAKGIKDGSTHEDILCNRIKIIKSALDNGISVVAFYDIASKLFQDEIFAGLFEQDNPEKDYLYFPIVLYKYNKTDAKLYGIPHLNRRYSYEKLKENLGIESVYPE